MIIFEIILFFFSIIILSTSIAGYGSLINFKNVNNIFIDIFLGLIVISLIITFTHFFFKISHIISFIIFFFGISVFFFKKKEKFLEIFKKKKKI